MLDETHFPFTGYQKALETVVRLAEAQPGMLVLDVGTGTANLATRFAALGCRLWGTDFSPLMLAEARLKLPHAVFCLADLRHAWPVELPEIFERIVSAYVFHHFDLTEKVRLCAGLAAHLRQGGRLVIADVAFPDLPSMERVRSQVGGEWSDEYYWLAEEIIPAFQQAGMISTYTPVSHCAGVFLVEKL